MARNTSTPRRRPTLSMQLAGRASASAAHAASGAAAISSARAVATAELSTSQPEGASARGNQALVPRANSRLTRLV
ncbi:MAG: hypothetical protein JWO52_4830 [Gammaproteobacteria bacterium]|nr:hypothetical protein [Gammaproteobacteria bacterium]